MKTIKKHMSLNKRKFLSYRVSYECLLHLNIFMEKIEENLAALFKKINEFERKYEKYFHESGDKVFLNKYHESSTKLMKLLSPNKDEVNKLDFDNILKLYSQAVLDFTYYEENKLVDNDFKAPDVDEQVTEILTEISEIEKFHNECSSNTMIETFGVEICECLHWRRGALLYMYCHTLYNDKSRQDDYKKCILKYTKEGVFYLQKMLSFREKDVEVDNKSSSKSNNTLSLIQKGIFGDTHMLAAMYAGEMCYWFWLLSKTMDWNENYESFLQFHKEVNIIATDLLKTYISAVDGPLKSMGWSSTRAKQILNEMT